MLKQKLHRNIRFSRQIFLYLVLISFISISIVGFLWITNKLKNYEKEVQQIKNTFVATKKLEIKNKILSIKDNIQWIQNMSSKPIIHTLSSQIYQLDNSIKDIKKDIHISDKIPKRLQDSLRKARIPIFIVNKHGKLLFTHNPLSNNTKLTNVELDLLQELSKQTSKSSISKYKYILNDSLLLATGYCNNHILKDLQVISIIKPKDIEAILQIHILDSIFKLRYSENEYVFINTLEGKALITHGKYNLHPINILTSGDTAWINIFKVQQLSSKIPEGVFHRYTWGKLATAGSSIKTSYFSYIPTWKWIIGYGFYDDDMNKLIKIKEDELNADLQQTILNILLFLVISTIIFYILVWFFSKQLGKNFELFTIFFEKAAKENQLIDTSLITYKEFIFMANAANLMVDERIKIENALKESEFHYRYLFEQNPVPMLIYELGNLKLLAINEAFVQLYGYSKEEALQMKLFDLYPEDEKKPITELTTKLSGLAYAGEWHHIKKDGSIMSIEAHSNGLKIDNQNTRIAVINDITARKKVEDEIRNLNASLELKVQERTYELESITEELKVTNDELHSTNENLQYANKELTIQKKDLKDTIKILQTTQKQLIESEKMASIGILAAGVAHEINNPLNFIQGGVSALNMFFDDTAKQYKNQVQVLLNSLEIGVTRAVDIVTSLNHFSRQSNNTNEKCNIHSIIDNCLTMLQNKTKFIIQINKHYTPEKFTIWGNEGKLHQAFLNIIVNSIDAIENKGEISITTLIKDNTISIILADNGIGIKEEYLNKIITPFFTTKEPGKGTGLGLAITHKIITEHNGTIEFESEYEKGTTVIVTLPLYTNE